jgi:hypothetical protein
MEKINVAKTLGTRAGYLYDMGFMKLMKTLVWNAAHNAVFCCVVFAVFCI